MHVTLCIDSKSGAKIYVSYLHTPKLYFNSNPVGSSLLRNSIFMRQRPFVFDLPHLNRGESTHINNIFPLLISA